MLHLAMATIAVVWIFAGDSVLEVRWEWSSSDFVPEMEIEKVDCRRERLVGIGRWRLGFQPRND